MDTSGSMDPSEIAAAQRAAQTFLKNVPEDTRVGLIDFDFQPRLLVKPTTNRTELETGLTKLVSGGHTALYDAVTMGVREAGAGGKVVILSDGVDSTHTTTLAQAQDTIAKSNVSVDAVAYVAGVIPAGLTELVTTGHGKVVKAQDAEALAKAFKDAALLAAAVDAKAATDAATVTVDKPLLPLWVAVVVVGLFLVVTGLLFFSRSRKDAQRQREAMEAFTGPSGFPQDAPEASEGLLGLSQRYVASRGREAKIALALDRAGLAMKPSEWVALRFCAGVVGAAVFAVLTHNVLVSVVLGGLVAWAATNWWLHRRQDKRAAQFADQLPDTLQIVASSLRSGFSLNQSLAAAHERGLEPMASELGRAMAAARIGANLEDELDAIAVRMRSEDWRWAVMAIRIQRNVGGNLAEVLLTTAQTLRERASMKRHVQALSAEGRLSAYILIALPIGVGGFMVLVRREYIEPLWTTTPGIVMLAAALGGIVMGWFWMRKVIEVEI
jgi:tight adherence protein B